MNALRRTDKTLLQQMRISEVEISRRRELLGLVPDRLALLSRHAALIEQHLDCIVNAFYEAQTTVDEIALLIGDADTLARLHAAQRRYISDLFCGRYDAEYVNNRLRIGMVHKRIGVEPKLYLAAVRVLKSLISTVLRDAIDDPDTLVQTLGTLDDLLYFDITLVFDTYIDSLLDEIETAKRRTEMYAHSLEEKVIERTRQLEEQAKRDPLTNLYNLRAMRELLQREIEVAKRHQRHLAFVYIDIDRFKTINDEQGHVAGDEVLKDTALAITRSVRAVDIACRYGGDEFCVILPECDQANAEAICAKIIQAFQQSHDGCSLSIGISSLGPGDDIASVDLIREADRHMYVAKQTVGFKICA